MLAKHLRDVEKGITPTNSLDDAHKAHPETFERVVKDILKPDSHWKWVSNEMKLNLLENRNVQSFFTSEEVSQLTEQLSKQDTPSRCILS